METVGRIPRHPKANPSSQRIPKIIRTVNLEIVENGGHIRHASRQVVGGRVVRLIALAVTSRIDKKQLVIVGQDARAIKICPILAISKCLAMQDKR